MTKTLTAVTPLGTFCKNTKLPLTHCAVCTTETMYGEKGRPGVVTFWSRSEAGARKLAGSLLGHNGFILAGVFPVSEMGA